MSPITRGFRGRRDDVDPARIPPGQHHERGFPVLTAGPTPQVDTATWTFEIGGRVDTDAVFTWQDLLALPQETFTVDIHCVTTWSKLDTLWTGVSVDTLLDGVEPRSEWVTIRAYGGYTTNLPFADLTGGKAWVVHTYDGQPLPPKHGGPARLLVPHLYFWKSAKWVNALQFTAKDEAGFWELRGYHMRGDPFKEERYG